MSGEFRRHLYAHDDPRLADVRGMDPYTYGRFATAPGTFGGDLVEGWKPLYENPFRGVTEDGELRADLYPLQPVRPGEEAPTSAMVAAATELLDVLDDADRSRLCFDVDAVEWQTWANPEFLQFDTGLRLDGQPPVVRQRAMALVRASLSPEGFAAVRAAMLINGFLGEVVDLTTILNAWSYNVALYGRPDATAPWGWQLFGHHLALNALVVDGHLTLSPVFLGAEPDEIDIGPHANVGRQFTERVARGRELMASLPEDQRAAAVSYPRMVDPAMPPGRVHPGDGRHLAGAFQDNRVIPVEGVPVAGMPADARRRVLSLAATFVGLLPAGPRAARMREIAAHLDQTWFSWIGGHGPDDVFYYRLQSPVLIAELDHHDGVFLDYDTPQPFHVHTLLRTPHGNDYGRAHLRAWQQRNGTR